LKENSKELVIVESPTKAKTIGSFLGRKFRCIASNGHIRDLPKYQFGVDISTFEPHYVVPRQKTKIANQIKKLASEAGNVYIATDEDREGEAIGWHILEIAKPKSYKRISFHEITKTAIMDAFKHPREINSMLVEAQEARRILDRVVGYRLSPLLSKKIARGLSAGRVQSVTLKLIVDREREITKFIPVIYFILTAELTIKKTVVEAKLTKVEGKRLKLGITDQKEAERIKQESEQFGFTIQSVTERKISKSPNPPLTTSRLQQLANNRLGYSPSVTMKIAQSLYEGKKVNGKQVGLITYMRTDSVNIAQTAALAAREFIKKNYGEQFIPKTAPVYKNSSSAQLAHEAIRPTDIQKIPKLMEQFLDARELKLYTLIWNSFAESQMTHSVTDSINISLSSGKTLWNAHLSSLKFPGWMIIEGKDSEKKLIQIDKNDKAALKQLKIDKKETEPPARYNAASLIKTLEKEGIGRPSTYATVVSTLLSRKYIKKEKRTFIPEEVSYKVTDRLVEYFPKLMDLKFTAHFETLLDEVAQGKTKRVDLLNEFWGPFSQQLEKAMDMPSEKPEDIPTDEKCPKCDSILVIKTGRFGKFLACSGFPKCKYTKNLDTDKVSGKCPKCGSELVKKAGRHGEFIACSGYPECKVILNETSKKCDSCGHKIYKIAKEDHLLCINENCLSKITNN